MAPIIRTEKLRKVYAVGKERVVALNDVDLSIEKGEFCCIVGQSGSGKSTLLNQLAGLEKPTRGKVFIGKHEISAMSETELARFRQAHLGFIFQSYNLLPTMTAAENVALPLQRYTKLSSAEIREQTSLKLALVGLAGFEDYYPSEISGGMRKRAGLARALAMDPEIVFFDEPSAGLDPVSAALLDELILELKENMGMTVVVVTHDLDSIFTIGNNSVFLDAATHTMITGGDPHVLRCDQAHPDIVRFLNRGKTDSCPTSSKGYRS